MRVTRHYGYETNLWISNHFRFMLLPFSEAFELLWPYITFL